jgi:hypothetical protein
MKEALERRAIWGEVDEETFICFSQYVYTGDYDEAKRTTLEVEEVTPDQVEQGKAVEASWKPFVASKRKAVFGIPSGPPSSSMFSPPATVMMTKKNMLWDTFNKLHPLPPTHSPGVSRVNGADDNYTEIFLCHARIYVFADYYGVEALQTLALCKLRQALATFKLDAESCGDINELIRYCFDKTVDNGEQADKLASLVCFYAACKVEDLWKNTEFQDLTRTLPDFPAGLITAMQGRLD